MSGGSTKLIEHRLGIQVVALLKHLHQYLVDRVESAYDAKGVFRTSRLACFTVQYDASLLQLSDKSLYKHILATYQQRR